MRNYGCRWRYMTTPFLFVVTDNLILISTLLYRLLRIMCTSLERALQEKKISIGNYKLLQSNFYSESTFKTRLSLSKQKRLLLANFVHNEWNSCSLAIRYVEVFLYMILSAPSARYITCPLYMDFIDLMNTVSVSVGTPPSETFWNHL